MTEVTHHNTAESQAFQKVNQDLRRCLMTWEEAGIPPSLAIWAATALIAETLFNALGDRGRAAEFMLAAMNSSFSTPKEGVN